MSAARPGSGISRRTVVRSLAGLGLLAFGSTACSATASRRGSSDGVVSSATARGAAPAPGAGSRLFGAEWESHARTFMSWPASADIWGDQLPGVRQDITRLARAVGGYEPVVMFARPEQADDAQAAVGNSVEVVPLAVDDLWARDTVPVFVRDAGRARRVLSGRPAGHGVTASRGPGGPARRRWPPPSARGRGRAGGSR